MFLEDNPSSFQRGMTQELSGSEQGTGQTNKKHRVKSLAVHAPALIGHVRDEYVVLEEILGIVFELSSAANEVQELLRLAVKSV